MPISQDLLNDMKVKLKTRIPDLKMLSVGEFVSFVEQNQLDMIRDFELSEVSVRRLDPEVLNALFDLVGRGEGGVFVFRHGEQFIDPAIATYDDVSKKIIMMQAEHNESDPITVSSAVEFMGTLLTMAYLKEKMGYGVRIEASSNCRAKEPAETLAELLDSPCNLSSQWTCINYRDDVDRSWLDSKGNLAWDKHAVDVVVGSGSFDKIIEDMRVVLAEPIHEKTVSMILTHTQQLDEYYAQASGKISVGRLSHYGFIFKNKADVLRCENGFYHPVPMPLRCELPSMAISEPLPLATDEVATSGSCAAGHFSSASVVEGVDGTEEVSSVFSAREESIAVGEGRYMPGFTPSSVGEPMATRADVVIEQRPLEYDARRQMFFYRNATPTPMPEGGIKHTKCAIQ